jgi:hypothetical protein
MMGIPPNVVLANVREIMVVHPLFINRGIGTGIVIRRAMKFGPTEFGKIVTERMKKDTHMPGIPQHLMPMLANRHKMFEGMAHDNSS